MRIGKHYRRRHLEHADHVAAMKALSAVRENDNDLEPDRTYAVFAGTEMAKNFMKREGVGPVEGEHFCIRTLLDGPSRGDRGCDYPPGCIFPPGSDHHEMWQRDGKHVIYTCHPYNLSDSEMEELVKFCDEYGLECTITGGSWYFPTRTLLMLLRRKN